MRHRTPLRWAWSTIWLALSLLPGSSVVLQARSLAVDRIEATLGPGASNATQEGVRIAYADAARGRPALSSITGLEAWANPLALWRATPKPRTIRLPDVTEWEAAITAYLGAHPETNVVIWSWSDHLASQTVDTVTAYMEAMSSLESGHPAVRFVYVTGHLGDDGSSGESAEGNERIRQYCRQNDKLLYDLAAVEAQWGGSEDSVRDPAEDQLQSPGVERQAESTRRLLAHLAGLQAPEEESLPARRTSADGERDAIGPMTPAAAPGTVTVNYSTSNGTATAGADYEATSGTLTFGPGETTKTISVNILADGQIEPTEAFTVTLSSPVGAALAKAQGTGTIIDGPMTPGFYQETDPRIVYEGTWTLVTQSGPSGGSNKYTNAPNGTASFRIVGGNRLTIYRTMNSNRGPMEVCVDSSCQTVENYSATLLWAQPVVFASLTTGEHQVTIRNTSTAYIDLDAIRLELAEADPPTNPSGLSSTSHTVGAVSADNTIDMTWSGDASDVGSGVAGYSVVFDQNATTTPDATVDLAAGVLGTSSTGLPDGSVYFHLRTCDNAGNCAAAIHAGPYVIDAVLPLPVGFYQETEPRIVYTGTWTLMSASGPSGGAIKYTNTLNATASFEFTGTGLKLYRTMNSNRGPMEVCVDGSCQTVQNYSATLLWAQPVTVVTGLANANHGVTIRNTSTAYIDVDAVEVLGALGPGYYEETISAVQYTGAWTLMSQSGPSGGSIKYTNTPNDTASFTMAGTGVTLYRTMNSNRGPMEVCVDSSCQTVQNYNATLLWAQPVTVATGLTNTAHNVTIRNTSAAYIDLDAIQVVGAGGPLTVGFHRTRGWAPALTQPTLQEDALEFTFLGTGLTLHPAPGFRGSFEVCVDGVCQVVSNGDSPVGKTVPVMATSGLANTTHTARVVARGSDRIGVHAVEVLGPLPTGFHEETHPALIYRGNWTDHPDRGASGGGTRLTREPGDSVSFEFAGTGLRLYRTLSNDRGPIEVCVDARCGTFESNAAELLWARPATVAAQLENATHSVTIRNTSAAPVDLDAIEVLGPLVAGYHEETSASLDYVGAWAPLAMAGPSGGSVRYTSREGDAVAFSFTGTGLTLYRTLREGAGIMEVCIDSSCETIDNRSDEMMWAQPVTVATGLASGMHAATIRNTSADRIDLDAVEVLP